jgi:hypothetical protein
MTDVNANIHIGIDSTGAAASLRGLEAQINQFQRSVSTSNASAAAKQTALNRALVDGINNTGLMTAKVVPLTDNITRFSHALENNKMSLGQYTRYAASQMPGMSRVFRKEFDMMERVATDRVKKIQSRYVALGKSAQGMQQALQITPNGLAKSHATDLAMAAQKQQIFNKLIDGGSTKMLNWGKNTQWAGRQLMVGFSLPLAALGTVAAKTFMEIDKASTALKRVYGDLNTSNAATMAAVDGIKALGAEYTKYGIALSETIDLSARVAATGAQGIDMYNMTEQTLRFATLGQMDYNTALNATISLQSAFGINSEDLAQNIDYLNAVENQTVLTIQDMAEAIPRVAPVIKGLGGDVKDLAAMLTAMREGGVTAAQGANALKSGLASLINPTDRAQASMAKLGIDMNAIINANRGDLLATVQAFGQALSKVSEFERQQALEQIFGKYQYARMGALFNNIADGASQASRAIDLMGLSTTELANLSEKELGKVAQSTTVKFAAAMEKLKIAIAPLGEAFLKGVMPIMDFITKILDAFTNLPDPIKNTLAVITGVIAGLGPVVLMTAGLVGNGMANIVKGIQVVRKRIAGIRGDAANFEYLAEAELVASGAANALEASMMGVTNSIIMQEGAMNGLIAEYERYVAAAGMASGVRGPRGPIRRAGGGTVPGTGTGDTVPALLTPGEFVVNKSAASKHGAALRAINSGSVKGFVDGGSVGLGPSQLEMERLVFAHAQAPIDLSADTLAKLKAVAPDSKYIQQANKAQGLSNFGVIAPERFNQGKMSGEQAARLFSDPKIVDRTMYPMYEAISRGLGRSVPDVMGDPKVRAEVQRFATGIGTGLATQGAQLIGDETFYSVVDKELERSDMHPDTKKAIQQSRNTTTVALYGDELRAKGERTSLGVGRQKSVFGASGGVSYKSTSMIAKAKKNIGAQFGQAVEQSLKIKSPSEEAKQVVSQYVAGMEVGAEQSAGRASAAGSVVGESFGEGAKKGVGSGTGLTKQQYRQQQSDARREARNRSILTQSGVTGVAQDRAIIRLREVEARQQQAKLAAQRQATTLAAQSAKVTEQTNVAKVAEIASEEADLGATQQSSRGRRFSGRGMGKLGMGLGMGSMVPFMMQNDQGKFAGMDANTLGMGMMGAGMTADMLAMSSGKMFGALGAALAPIAVPAAAVTAALIAVGIGLKIWRNNVDESSRSAAKLGANLGGAANAANIMADMTGKLTPVQRREQVKMGDLSENQKANMGDYTNMLESDAGKKMLDELKAASSTERFSQLSDYVKTAVATGVMESDFAAGFVKTVSTQLGDGLLGKNVLADLDKFSKSMTSNTDGMLKLANERKAATTPDLANAIAGKGDMSIASAGSVVGQALQGIQDFSNVAALAEEEFSAGNLAYSDYIAAVRQSTDVQNQYTNALIYSIQHSADSGGTKQAFVDQMKAMGFSEDSANSSLNFMDNAGQNAASAVQSQLFDKQNKVVDELRQTMDAAQKAFQENPSPETGAALERAQSAYNLGATAPSGASQQQLESIKAEAEGLAQEVGAQMVTAMINGMSPADAQKIAESIINPTSVANAAYKASIAQGGSATSAYETAGIAMRENGPNATAGVAKGGYAAATGSLSAGGGASATSIDALLQSIPEGSRQALINYVTKKISGTNLGANRAGNGGQFSKDWVDATGAASKASGGADVSKLGMSAGWVDAIAKKGPEIDKVTKSLADLKNVLGGQEGAVQAYIDLAMEDPDNVVDRLPELTKRMMDFDAAVPMDIRKVLNIDIADPAALDQFMGIDFENLKTISAIIQDIPDETTKTFAASVAFDNNGKPVDSLEFADKVKAINKAVAGLKSDKKVIRKESVVKLLQYVEDQDGNKLTKKQAQNAYQELIDTYGEQKILQLPTDMLTKVIQFKAQAAGLKESAAALRKLAQAAYLMGDSSAGAKYDIQAGALDSAAAAFNTSIKGAVAQGTARGGNDLPKASGGGGGGGGGDKSNPFKDWKSAILKQIQQYADASATLKTLMSAKYNFHNLLKLNDGIDDRVRKAGLTPGIQEYLMGLDPKDAKKVLAKITDKKTGKLNKVGLALQDRYMGGQISQTRSEAQGKVSTVRMQRAAWTRLTSARTGNAEAAGLIAGDPKLAEQYIYLIKKANEAEKNFKATGGKAAKKAWNAAKQDVRDYVAEVIKANKQEAAMAADIALGETQNATKGAMFARSQGASKDIVSAIAGNQQWSARAAEIAKLFNNPKTRAEAQKQWDALVKRVTAGTDAEIKLQIATDPIQFALDQVGQEITNLNAEIEDKTQTMTLENDAAFASTYGKTKEEAQLVIDKNQMIIDQYQIQIDAMNEKVNLLQHEVDIEEHSKKVYQDQIDAIQDIVDGMQRKADALQHEVDLRNHNADLLNHELDLMQQQEDTINEAYDKRIEALTKVQALNDHLIQQQQQQLGLAQALSQGDVYAAAAAANEMQAGQVQFAGDQAMQNLEQGRKNAIEGVVGGNGMTRKQIEEEIYQIGQQNYQTEQQIYQINQDIFTKNLELIPIKEAIAVIDADIAAKNEVIWQRNKEIYDYTAANVKPLQDANKSWSDRLNLSASTLKVTLTEGLVKEQAEMRLLKLSEARLNALKAEEDRATRIGLAWKNIVNQIADANQKLSDHNYTAAHDPELLGEAVKYNADGSINTEGTLSAIFAQYGKDIQAILDGAPQFSKGGIVGGWGNSDTVPAMLTPGEGVVTKSAMKRYGTSFISSLNNGSFPQYTMPSTSSVSSSSAPVANVNAPVYNSYSVNVNSTSVDSADDIANTVITRIRNIEGSSIRRISGY